MENFRLSLVRQVVYINLNFAEGQFNWLSVVGSNSMICSFLDGQESYCFYKTRRFVVPPQKPIIVHNLDPVEVSLRPIYNAKTKRTFAKSAYFTFTLYLPSHKVRFSYLTLLPHLRRWDVISWVATRYEGLDGKSWMLYWGDTTAFSWRDWRNKFLFCIKNEIRTLYSGKLNVTWRLSVDADYGTSVLYCTRIIKLAGYFVFGTYPIRNLM